MHRKRQFSDGNLESTVREWPGQFSQSGRRVLRGPGLPVRGGGMWIEE